MLSSATFSLNVRIILSDLFFGGYYSYIVCVCNHYCRTNQNRSTMSLTIHLSCLSDDYFFLSCFFLFDLLELVSFDELDLFDHDSDNDGSGSGSPGTFNFPFSFGKSVGSAGESVSSYCESIDSVSGVGSGDFFSIEIKSIGDFFPLVVLVPRGIESKGGRLVAVESKGSQPIESCLCPKS